MSWSQVLKAHRSAIVVGLVAFGVLLAAGLIYAPGGIWKVAIWILLGATAVIVATVLGQLLYAVVSLESGYRPGDQAGPSPSPSVPVPSEKLAFQVAPRPATSVGRSTEFDEALADLRAAQYLLSKVQASGAFREFSEMQRRECTHALEEVRALLGNIARDKAIQKFAS
jgi:hypothetical protein